MLTVIILALHLIFAASLVGVVLLQRSEGGGLGIGGGGSGGFMTGRGTANMLTRATAVLAALFFATSISLTLLARQTSKPVSPLDAPSASRPAVPAKSGDVPGEPAKAPAADGGLLKQLEGGKAPLPKSQ